MANENPNPNSILSYYQTRAAHHGIVISDWLEQTQAAIRRYPDQDYSDSPVVGRPFSTIEEFSNWRQQPNLAEAVEVIRSLAAVIRASEATTMMELEIKLKKASDTLKKLLVGERLNHLVLLRDATVTQLLFSANHGGKSRL